MRRALRSILPLLVLMIAAASADAQGVLEFDRTLHDFGEIDAGDQVETVFTFRNSGNQPVIIRTVRPSCGCTVPDYSREAVQPGESGQVTVGFNPVGRSGAVRQSVVITADVGKKKEAVESLVITANVIPVAVAGGGLQGGVRFDRDEVDAGRIPADRPYRHRFMMQRTGTEPLTIHTAHSFPQGAEIRVPQTPIFREDVVAVEVVLPPHMVSGRFAVAIALETDDAEEPIKALKLTGFGE